MKVYQVLFLCSGNSGRSIMGEAILTRVGGERFRACSAGSHPTGRVNPLTFNELTRRGYPPHGLTSKSWTQFSHADAPQFDYVIWVCESAAGEDAPVWRGRPQHLHWQLPAPGQVSGSDQNIRAAFTSVCAQVEEAVTRFVHETLATEPETALSAR
ncbi:MAG: arsenate reductase ArsC [Massilia sp.]